MVRALPRHVAVIMDGNGRWAKKRLLPRVYGHRKGMERMMGLICHAFERGVSTITVYALSTENLSRPKRELDGLFSLFREYFSDSVKKLYAAGAEIRTAGDLSPLPEDVQKLIAEGVANSPKDGGRQVVFALNYGGRAEIIRAVNLAVEAGERVDEEKFAALLYSAGLPEPDLIIRTGGELRLSNFLIYQAAYSELYFTDVLFPDFTDGEFDKALSSFGRRERRFGKITEDTND